MLKYILILVTIVLAIIGWLKPNRVPVRLSVAVVALVLLGGVVQILITKGDERAKRELAYTGFLQKKRFVLSRVKNVLPRLEIGDSGAVLVYAGPQGQPLLSIFDDNSLEIWVDNGHLMTSTLIRDKSGRVVAELKANEWAIKPERIWDRNYTRDALEVIDETGDVILQIKLLNDRIQFSGKFYSKDGQGFGIGKMTTPLGTGGVFEITGSAHPELELRVLPMFKYPSSRHLGEFR